MIEEIIKIIGESGMSLSMLVDRLEEIKENDFLVKKTNPKLKCRYYEIDNNIIVLNVSSFNYPKLNRDDISHFSGVDINHIQEIHPEYTYYCTKNYEAIFYKNRYVR